MRRLSGGVVGLLMTLPATATATYSIVAADAAAREVGGAVTSCVAPQSVDIVYRSVPGRGAMNTQATWVTLGSDRGVAMLEAGAAPAEVIAEITSSAFDSGFQSRQYGVADLSGRAAGYTGVSTLAFSADRQGSMGSFVYSVQGNILTSVRVLDQAEAGFRATGCDLAERLMLALEEGAQNGEGDSRCTTRYGIPSDASSIEVDRAGEEAGTYLRLAFTSTETVHEDPIVRLRGQFDAWRATHPCPTAGGAGGAGGSATSSGGGGVVASDDRGCGCRVGRRGSAGAWCIFAASTAGAWLARRRGRRGARSLL
ncbi:MAG: DUF1028 domain-containing protein [Polyangiaceae bacterium]